VNPDKLFDYLDGRLSTAERDALEERLVSDEQLQRELAVARRIHAGIHGDSREVLLESDMDRSERGRKLARRIGVTFIILMTANVGVGLWFIVRHENQNPNRRLLEAQMRQQLANSLHHAAANELGSERIGVTDLRIVAPPGQLEWVANQVVDLAQRLGGTATKGIAEEHRVGVVVDLPRSREADFRVQLGTISAAPPSPDVTGGKSTGTSDKESFAVEIVDKPKQ
jgi:anti-sigma factor RsiW